jgi:serine/threonine protein kinase
MGKVQSQGTIVVREAIHVDTGQRFAAKVVSKELLRGNKTYCLGQVMEADLGIQAANVTFNIDIDRIAMVNEEFDIMLRVHHPNCISLVDIFETESRLYLIMELAEGGNLFDQLLKKGNYPEVDAARLVRDILLGVEYLHSVGIVHGDLKLEDTC